jgi:hypothetical protein
MFEFDQEIVKTLLEENSEFKRLYEKHSQLKERVRDANLGAAPIDDYTLEKLKKEKLYLKDRMAMMIESYRRTHAQTSAAMR